MLYRVNIVGLPSTLFLPNTRHTPFHNLPQFPHFIEITHFVIYPNWWRSSIYLVRRSTLSTHLLYIQHFGNPSYFGHLPCLCFYLVSLSTSFLHLPCFWVNNAICRPEKKRLVPFHEVLVMWQDSLDRGKGHSGSRVSGNFKYEVVLGRCQTKVDSVLR